MTSNSVTITAPTRIHFGLFSIDETDDCQFGGMGVMVKNPCVKLCCSPSDKLFIKGSNSDAVSKIVFNWHKAFHQLVPQIQTATKLPVAIELIELPSRHSGFGSGTQLSLAVASLLFNALNLPTPGGQELAIAMNRGRRSAIGSYGFFRGGFLVDRGITPSDPIAPLELRIDFPADWRVVLFLKRQSTGMHGKLENVAFENLGTKKSTNRETMTQICSEQIVPAIVDSAYKKLGLPLFDFNRLSGEYYSEYQFGCYHDEDCLQIVNEVRAAGVDAVGQSSWGPCIFAITQNEEHADSLIRQLQKRNPNLFDTSQMTITVTEADNSGAKVETNSIASQSS